MTDPRPTYNCTSRPPPRPAPPPPTLGTPVLSLRPLVNARITASTRSTSTLTKPRRYSPSRSTPRVLPSFREIAVMVLLVLTITTCSSVSSSGKVAAAPITVDGGGSTPKNEIYDDAGPSREALEEEVAVGDSTTTSRTLDSFVVSRGTMSTSSNVALNMPTFQSSTAHGGVSSRAVDGNSNGSWSAGSVTHTDEESNPLWEVDLGHSHLIIDIVVYNRRQANHRLKNFELSIVLGSKEVWKYYHNGDANAKTNISVPPDKVGDHVIITLPGDNRVLSLAEVEVYGIIVSNVALNMPTFQSSTAHGGVSSRAVDGNSNGSWSAGSVTHTDEESNPLWKVDLGHSHLISDIVVYNRRQANDRLKNFELSIVLGLKEVWKYYHNGDANAKTNISVPPDKVGDHVIITLPGDNKVLSLAEVEVYGVTSWPYELWDVNAAGKCPSGLEVSQDECLHAGNEVSGLNMEKLVVGDWDYTPCGCFTWENRKVNFKDEKHGNCKKHEKGPLVCKKKARVTFELQTVLNEIENEARSCQEGAADTAWKIKTIIIPHFQMLGRLQYLVDKMLAPFETIYKKRYHIKLALKMVPKVGKVLNMMVTKIIKLYEGFKKTLVPILKALLLEELTPSWATDLSGVEAGEPTSRVKYIIKLLTKLEEILNKQFVGLGPIAGDVADTAVESQALLQSLSTGYPKCIVNVEAFSREVMDEFKEIRDASRTCTEIPRYLEKIKLQFLEDLVSLMEQLYEAIGPVIEQINDIIDTMTSTAMEVACCTVSVQDQAVLSIIATLIDYSTCFAGPVEGIIDEILRMLIPDIGVDAGFDLSIPWFNYSLPHITFVPQTCKVEKGAFELERDDIDIEFEFKFSLYDFLGIEGEYSTDITDILSDISKSCDPNKLVDEITGPPGDCCCAAREIELKPGNLCLDYLMFQRAGMYEIASVAADLERCSCCEDGVYSTKGCKGATGYCGTSPPPTKKEGDACPSTVDCECGLDGMACGKRSYYDATYVCCKESFVPAGWTTDLCSSRKLGQTCPTTEDDECEGSLECGWETASDSAKYTCCKKTGIFFGNDYCLDMPEDSICHSDRQCASGYCRGNNGGTTKGKCYQRRGVGQSCAIDNDCQNGACGRKDAGNSSKRCCSSGSTSRWTNQKDYCNGLSVGTACNQDSNCQKGGCGRAWYGTDTKKCCNGGVTRYWKNQKDYCEGMPNGYNCRTDAMCSSGWCNNNKCQARRKEGESCNSQKNAECFDGSCYRSIRYGAYKCCKSTNFCDAWNGGCTTGYHYCRYYGSRLG